MNFFIQVLRVRDVYNKDMKGKTERSEISRIDHEIVYQR